MTSKEGRVRAAAVRAQLTAFFNTRAEIGKVYDSNELMVILSKPFSEITPAVTKGAVQSVLRSMVVNKTINADTTKVVPRYSTTKTPPFVAAEPVKERTAESEREIVDIKLKTAFNDHPVTWLSVSALCSMIGSILDKPSEEGPLITSLLEEYQHAGWLSKSESALTTMYRKVQLSQGLRVSSYTKMSQAVLKLLADRPEHRFTIADIGNELSVLVKQYDIVPFLLDTTLAALHGSGQITAVAEPTGAYYSAVKEAPAPEDESFKPLHTIFSDSKVESMFTAAQRELSREATQRAAHSRLWHNDWNDSRETRDGEKRVSNVPFTGCAECPADAVQRMSEIVRYLIRLNGRAVTCNTIVAALYDYKVDSVGHEQIRADLNRLMSMNCISGQGSLDKPNHYYVKYESDITPEIKGVVLKSTRQPSTVDIEVVDGTGAVRITTGGMVITVSVVKK